MKKENRLLTIDGETLMSQPLTPLNFVVDTLLSQGLHILAGSPKVGKSWLALWLAVTVAKGEAVWGMGAKKPASKVSPGTGATKSAGALMRSKPFTISTISE